VNVSWKWAEDGKSVEIGGAAYQVAGSKGDEVAELEWLFRRARAVYGDLVLARASFKAGQARYEDAHANLCALYDEMGKGESELARVTSELDSFFTPPDISKAFGGDTVAFGKFFVDAMARLVKLG